MVLVLEEISKEDFQFLSDLSFTYFQNGVIFNDCNDDVIAFEKTNFKNDNSLSYWKVVGKNIKELPMSENDVKKTNIITVIINCVITVLSIILKAITG